MRSTSKSTTVSLLASVLGAVGLMDFGASAAMAEINKMVPTPKNPGRMIHDSNRKGTLVTAEGKKRMAARKAAYHQDGAHNDFVKVGCVGKLKWRDQKLVVASGGFHVQYNKMGTIRELAKLTTN